MNTNNYIMAPKLFNTGFLENDSKLRQKQGLPIQEFGLQHKKPSQYGLCNNNEVYPVQSLAPNYGNPCSCSNNPNTPMSAMKI